MSHKASESQAKPPSYKSRMSFPHSIRLHPLIVILPLVMKEGDGPNITGGIYVQRVSPVLVVWGAVLLQVPMIR